jgi:hypothetical protein
VGWTVEVKKEEEEYYRGNALYGGEQLSERE